MNSRRPQGEGSVYRLPNGRWRGVVNLGWHAGKRRRKYITRGTQAEVVRQLRRLTAAAAAGRLPIERAPKLRLYIAPALGKVPLDKLKPSEVSEFTVHSCCVCRRGAGDCCMRFTADR